MSGLLRRLKQRKQQRQRTSELGEGLWRRAHDRFVRALDRYHQILEGVTDTEDYNQLAALGNELAELLPVVHQLCADCQASHPSDELTVPHAGRPVHAKLSAAANSLATTAEAAALFRLGQVEIEQVRFRAQRVHDDIAAASEAAATGQPS